jgi:hypothetical protein
LYAVILNGFVALVNINLTLTSYFAALLNHLFKHPCMDSGSKVPSQNQLEQNTFLQYRFFGLIKQERVFLVILGLSFFIAGVVFQSPALAMWIGFAFAGYSAIANDSIQTIGTFLSSNSSRKWWVLWLYIGGIFVFTVAFSWYTYDGDVSYQRLTSKGFDQAPSSFSFLQIAAPLFLLILTRLRMPVSTTFLILSAFSSDLSGITGMLEKSFFGYITTFTIAFLVWLLLNRLMNQWFKGQAAWWWYPLQWITSGMLWSVWIMQDAANIAVYLPRSLHLYEFIGFTSFIFLGLGVLFYLRGDKIQQIITEKSQVTDVRPATVIDFVYAILLFYFKMLSTIPMSTTWVFIGLLAGRELAMSLTDANGKGKPLSKTLRLIGKDISYAGIGLFVSIALAMAINPVILEQILSLLGY